MRFSVKDDGNWRAFNHRNYRILFRANALSNTGTWVQRIAQSWLILQLTHNGTYLGIVSALQIAPFLLISLHGGALADRLNKRLVLVVTNIAGSLTALTLGLLIVTHHIQLWHVLVLAFVLGVIDSIDKPVRQSFASELVGKKDLLNAISLNSANFNMARLVGPAASGLLIAAFGTGPAFIINAISYLPVIYATTRIRESELYRGAPAKGPMNIKQGLHYVQARPDILVTMVVGFFMATFSMNFEIFNALIATKVFNKGVAAYGFLGTILAIGSLSSALLSPRMEKYRSTRFVILGSICFGIAIFICALMPTYLAYSIALPVAGAIALIIMISSNSVSQINTDHIIRGRVMGIYQLVLMAGTPISSPAIGWFSEHFGVRQTMAGCATITILASTVIWIIFKDKVAVPTDISVAAVLKNKENS